jgi:hypothetical protein
LASIWSVGSRWLLPKTTVCDLAINWYLWIIYTWIKKNLNIVYNLPKRYVMKQWLTPGTFNGSMSRLLAWWQISNPLALLGHKCNNLTSRR